MAYEGVANRFDILPPNQNMLSGITEAIQGAIEQKNKMKQLQYAGENDKAVAILKGLIEGNLTPTGAGQTPTIPIQGARIPAQGMGQKIMQGLGIQQPQYEQGQGYNVQPNLDRQLKQATIDLYEGSNANQLNVIPLSDGETTYSPDDYQIKSVLRNVRGIPTTMNEKELKPALDEKDMLTINAAANTLNYLKSAKGLSKGGVKTGFFTGFNPAMPLGTKFVKQFGGEKDIALNQVLRQMQSAYITSQTGAQRGFQEMTWYEPAMPTGDLPPEKLQGMLDSTAKLQELNVRNLLISSQKNGKRLGGYKEQLNQLMKKYPLEEYPFGMPQGEVMKKLGSGEAITGKTQNQLSVGTIEDGYRFKGGDPSDQNNWEKI